MNPGRSIRGRKLETGTSLHDFANDFTHIADPNLRRRLALSEIDKAPFGSYHIRAILVTGVGFFLDSYAIFSINLITVFLGLAFWQGGPEDARYGFGGNYGTLPTPVAQALKVAMSAGMLLGQIAFGCLADALGRRRVYGIELIIVLVATLPFALANPSSAMSSTGVLVFWRVVMGVGIGGDYPMSAVIMSEFAPTRWRGAMLASVFSMQGIGQLVAAIVALAVTVAFKSSFKDIQTPSECGLECQVAADRCWRIIAGLGAVPVLFALYFRMTIPETPRYTFDVALDVDQADADIRIFVSSKLGGEVEHSAQGPRPNKPIGPPLSVPPASWRDVMSHFGRWSHTRMLLGTTLSWFFLDFAFYGLSLNKPLVLAAIGTSNGHDLYGELYHTAVATIILTAAGSLPGYWLSILTIDTVGRKTLQIFGFLALTLIFCILGFAGSRLTVTTTVALHTVARFFFNLGPNTTTFVIPAECFPTRYRASGHGLSAASGKLGAVAAQLLSAPFLRRFHAPAGCAGPDCTAWLGGLMRLFALFMLCGALASLLVPETAGASLEELAGEEPTSYNAGCNGSIRAERRSSRRGPRRLLNPFLGRRPAGFAYPRSSWGRRRSARKCAQDAELSMSTAAGAASAASGCNAYDGGDLEMDGHNGHGHARGRGASQRMVPRPSGDVAGPSGSSSPSVRVPGEGISLKNVSLTLNRSGRVPSWNAGWGRIDRGVVPADAHLQDVGGLIH